MRRLSPNNKIFSLFSTFVKQSFFAINEFPFEQNLTY